MAVKKPSPFQLGLGGVRAGAEIATTLLRCTRAAVRCRISTERNAWPEAKQELLQLQEGLLELSDLRLDSATWPQVEALREMEQELRHCLARAEAPLGLEEQSNS